jgi:hypothetical protein
MEARKARMVKKVTMLLQPEEEPKKADDASQYLDEKPHESSHSHLY